MSSLTRRSLLLGAAGFGLAACGSQERGSTGANDASAKGGSGNVAGPSISPDKYVPFNFFKSGTAAANVPYRYPFGLGTVDHTLEANGPETIAYRILDKTGKVIQPSSTTTRHAKDLARPYWPVTATLPAGTYEVELKVGSRTLPRAPIEVVNAASITVLGPGAKAPSIITPTVKDPAGVKRVCTREPPCPLHEMTLADALKSGKPTAFLIATPAYCQTAICGPVLDVLLKHQTDKILFIHSEVYVDDPSGDSTEAVRVFGLDYEPALFLIKPDGTIADRLDVIFDSDDVAAALNKLTTAS